MILKLFYHYRYFVICIPTYYTKTSQNYKRNVNKNRVGAYKYWVGTVYFNFIGIDIEDKSMYSSANVN